jgi:hypothetical protein
MGGPGSGPGPSAGPSYMKPKRRRVATENAITKVNPSEPKRALFHCNYCQKDISNVVRMKCAVCAEMDLCVECFSVGVEPHPHQACHAYHVIDNLSFPLFTMDWGADEVGGCTQAESRAPIAWESAWFHSTLAPAHCDIPGSNLLWFHINLYRYGSELLLLEAIEMYGLGNWTEAGRRTLTPPDPQPKGARYPGGFQPSHLSREKLVSKRAASNGSTCAATPRCPSTWGRKPRCSATRITSTTTSTPPPRRCPIWWGAPVDDGQYGPRNQSSDTRAGSLGGRMGKSTS